MSDFVSPGSDALLMVSQRWNPSPMRIPAFSVNDDTGKTTSASAMTVGVMNISTAATL